MLKPIASMKLDDCASGYMTLSVVCPDCAFKMCADTTGCVDSWNEGPDLCVITVICPKCQYSGSIHVNFDLTT